MLTYAAKRFGLAALICLLAMTVMFALVFLIPGDPASIALGPLATPAMKAALRAKMGLDEPMLVQLANFIVGVLHGNLGVDVWSGRSVTSLVGEALPYTLALAAAGLGWAALIGIPLGCYSAIRQNSWIDRLSGVVSVGAISLPSFVVAVYALLVFSVYLNWFPAIGAGAEGNPLDELYHLVLPAFAVGVGWVGYLARLVRASMLEVMAEAHIRTARAFGLTERTIVLHYALRIAVLPTVTLIGLGMGSLLSSAVFAEAVFNRPGIGKLVLSAVETRNYPVMMGAVLVTVALFAFFTLVADLIVALLDPRVRAGL